MGGGGSNPKRSAGDVGFWGFLESMMLVFGVFMIYGIDFWHFQVGDAGFWPFRRVILVVGRVGLGGEVVHVGLGGRGLFFRNGSASNARTPSRSLVALVVDAHRRANRTRRRKRRRLARRRTRWIKRRTRRKARAAKRKNLKTRPKIRARMTMILAALVCPRSQLPHKFSIKNLSNTFF